MDENEGIAERKTLGLVTVRPYFPVLLVFILGISLSVTLFRLVHAWEMTNQRSEFESRVGSYANALQSTLHEYAGAALFIGDYFDNSEAVSREEFTNLVNQIQPRYPGIQSFGWDPLVRHDQRATYEQQARDEGFASFMFTEKSAHQGMIRAENRAEYVVVYYMHPHSGNEAGFGYDIASEQTRKDAIEAAFDTGKLTSTHRIKLVQETGSQFGVLLLRPIYFQGKPLVTAADRYQNRKGFVVEVLRIGQVMDTAMQGYADEGISITLYDLSAAEDQRLLHHKPTKHAVSDSLTVSIAGAGSRLNSGQSFNFAERQWRVVFDASDYYLQFRKMLQGWTVLLTSLLMTLMLGLYMLRRILHTQEIEATVVKQACTNQQLKDEIRVRGEAEAARDQTILELQHAIDEVKKLRGILPICASCKKIRDDKGYWNQIESYISSHSDAEFSHGICPECAPKYFSELTDS